MASSAITNEGMAVVAALLAADVGETAFDYVGIGTGTTAASATDTWLETQQQVSQATTCDRTTTSVTNDTLRLIVDSFSFSGSHAITEAIAANASTDGAGECLCHFVFDAVNVTASDTLKVTITVQVKQGA